jgi:hypothetical protein
MVETLRQILLTSEELLSLTLDSDDAAEQLRWFHRKRNSVKRWFRLIITTLAVQKRQRDNAASPMPASSKKHGTTTHTLNKQTGHLPQNAGVRRSTFMDHLAGR